MKPFIVFLTYIIGFIIFYKSLLWLNIDQKFFSFFSLSDTKIKKKKIGDSLTPEGASKPLAIPRCL